MAASGLENRDFAAHVAAGDDTGAADKAGADVGEDTAIQVGHDHDVELLGFRDALHRGIVDDHVVSLNGGIFLANFPDGISEETIGELHDVGFVYACHSFPVVG